MMAKKVKKLYRSTKNQMIAGVCGGIGEYLKIDASIVRLAWVLMLLMKGAGILFYFICWIVIPKKAST
jgi:phage shock protein PspC (stress-responsive transcriptional regulator)